MTNAPDGDMTEDSPFSGGFDLYSSGKRRRGGLRRLTPASTAVVEPETAPEATATPAAAAEPRTFSRMFAHRQPPVGAAEESPRLRQDDVEHPELATLADGSGLAAAEASLESPLADESPMMGPSALYASRTARRPSGPTRLALPAVAVIAIAAGGAWFLMNPPHAARTDQTSMVAGGGPAPVMATAPAAPAPVDVAPLAPPAAAIAPPETATPPAPIATATPPAPARIARTTTTVTTTSTAHRVAANARHAPRVPARSADTSGADVSTQAPDTAPAYTPPAYVPPAYTPGAPPAPVITAPPPAPSMTPAVTPPVDPSGAVNAPTTP